MLENAFEQKEKETLWTTGPWTGLAICGLKLNSKNLACENSRFTSFLATFLATSPASRTEGKRLFLQANKNSVKINTVTLKWAAPFNYLLFFKINKIDLMVKILNKHPLPFEKEPPLYTPP